MIVDIDLRDPIAVLAVLERDCGADAFTIEAGHVVALKLDIYGNLVVLKKYPLEIQGRAS